MPKLDMNTPEGAFWAGAVTDQRSMESYLRDVELVEGPEALEVIQSTAEGLVESLDNRQFEEGE